jgi:hypothetical protein
VLIQILPGTYLIFGRADHLLPGRRPPPPAALAGGKLSGWSLEQRSAQLLQELHLKYMFCSDPKIPPLSLPSCRFASPNSSKSSSFIKSLIPALSSNTSRAKTCPVGSEITNRRQQLENTNLQRLLVDLLVALLLPLPLPRGRHDLSVPQEATHETHHQELPGLIRYPGQGGAEPQEGRLLQESARASQAAVVLKRILYHFFFKVQKVHACFACASADCIKSHLRKTCYLSRQSAGAQAKKAWNL